MAVSKQPTITPETSSGEGLDEEPSSRGEAKWKRFHPFRVVRKIFRRRIKREGTNVVSDSSKKSWSTSELQSVQDDSTGKCEVTSPLKIGLSVSHDSIFSPENNSNIVSNETLNVPHGSSLSVRHTSMKNMFKDELFTRIRARRDSDDDGIGMQNSPYSSPTTVDILNQGFKEKLPKSQTTCSAGSLISMGSSENDEDSTGQSSGHSSRMSLIDRRSLDSEADSEVANPVPLNHNAAHHKIAIRPKRNYGLPRRRMKQVAAAKVISLPSTPEVTEDLNKCLQQLEVTEIAKSATEFSIMSEKETISSSVLSFEKHTISHSSTILSSEVSQITSETQYVKEKAFSDSTVFTKTDIDDGLKYNTFQSDLMQETDVNTDDLKVNNEVIIDKRMSDVTHKSLNVLGECKQSLTNRNDEGEIESYKLIKNTMQEKPKCDTMFQDCLMTAAESSISVSSLVKNIEKSDSFKSTEKSRKFPEDTKLNLEKHSEHHESSIESKRVKEFENDYDLKHLEELKSRPVQGIQNIVDEFSEPINVNSSQEIKMTSPADCVNEIIKRSTVSEKLDIESEFVLKPFKKDRRFSGEFDSSYSDAIPEKQKDNSLVSSVYLEEESIMSNKSLSVGIEESRIFVSHHTSFSDDLKDILVTEAHNYAAVDEKSEVSIKSVEEVVSSKEKEICDPYISSVGISSPMASENDITYSSSLSALCDKRMSEDKITISINSNADNLKTTLISPQSDDGISRTSVQKNSSATETKVNQKVSEKQSKSTHKSHLPDISSNMVSVKNTNSQKRVSVEIVPFSQRMKERKYQPISFANKECSSENKKNSSALVERKLSDRKVTKNKDLDKSNNRHSFSGSITSDSKKDSDLTSGKKEKNEKVQYPVQIRIHKSSPKPDVKDKIVSSNTSSEFKSSEKESTSDVKFHMHSSKTSQSEVKLLKEENKNVESTPKWEIKIQPAASQQSISQTSCTEETNSSVQTQRNFILKSESFKSSQFTGNESKDTADLETSVTKSQDGSWKSSKDSSVLSDDPEPELLRVFARRSIKQKHCDKSKIDDTEKDSDETARDSVTEVAEKNKDVISISLNSTVIKISENSKPHITKPDLKKKSKSFCEKEKVVPRSVSPLKEMNLIQRDSSARSSADSLVSSENLHPRQRIVNLDDAPPTLPPESEKKSITRSAQNESITENSLTSKEEQSHRSCSISTPPPSTSVNGSLSSVGMVKENQDVMAGKEGHTPAWLQLAQQRRELREQRERLLLGGSPNSFMDGSSKPSRSSKVWDMVNNFQKLQMT